MNSRTLGDRKLYKVLLAIIKYVPMIIAVLFIIGTLFNIFGVSALIISCIGGTSIITLILLYLLSYVFRFCYLYRLPLHYITLSNTLLILHELEFISSIILTIELLALVLGIFIILYVLYWYRNRNKPKVDPIKNFCERYCECC